MGNGASVGLSGLIGDDDRQLAADSDAGKQRHHRTDLAAGPRRAPAGHVTVERGQTRRYMGQFTDVGPRRGRVARATLDGYDMTAGTSAAAGQYHQQQYASGMGRRGSSTLQLVTDLERQVRDLSLIHI